MSEVDSIWKWFKEEGLTFFGTGEYIDEAGASQASITAVLGLDEEELKPFSKAVLRELGSHENVQELAQGIWAYSQFQDILGIAVHMGGPWLHRHYCYYESLVYLHESVTSWLDRNVLASLALLRPFLELSVMHLYWHIKCEIDGYGAFYKWMEGEKGKTPFKDQLEYVFNSLTSRGSEDNQRILRIKDMMTKVYRSASAYNHSPKLDESIVGLSGGTRSVSLHSFFYYLAVINIVLRQVVYLYVLVYPQSVFPIDRYKKWGFGGPLGLVFDYSNFYVLKAYLGHDNIVKMQNDLASASEVTDFKAWVDSIQDMSKEEINLDWEKQREVMALDYKVEEMSNRIAHYKAHQRALGWALNYIHEPLDLDQISDEAVKYFSDMLREW